MDKLTCSPSTQNNMNSHELEDSVTVVGLKSSKRQMCRIAFEDYHETWMKIATTNSELRIGCDSLDEFIKYTEQYAVHYGSASGEKECLVQAQRNIPVEKFPKKDTKGKHKRVERMRRLYIQCRAAEQIPGPGQGSDRREHWEKEMDELVEWTHSLSLKELDDL